MSYPSVVNNCILNLDNKAWHAIESIAERYPISVRALAIPVAIGTFLRDTLEAPGKCLEEIIRSGKSLKDFINEPNSQRAVWHLNSSLNHAGYAIGYALKTIVAPLIGSIDAIISFVKIIFDPLLTAKINASKQEIALLIQEKGYAPYRTTSNGKVENFACEYEFARSEWQRFANYMKTHQHDQNPFLIFMPTEAIKQRKIQNIEEKMQKFDDQKANYLRKLHEICRIDDAPLCASKREVLRLEWVAFQNTLITALNGDVAALVFTPSA